MASDREKAKRAIAAMRGLGISDEKTKTVLGKLLKVYDKNWYLIEGENYRVLADAIFQEEEEGDMGGNLDNKSNSDGEENGTGDERVPPLRMPERRNTRQVAEEKMNSNSQLLQGIDREESHDAARPLKRLRRGGQGQVSPSPPESMSRPGGIILKEPKKEVDDPATFAGQQFQGITESRAESLSGQPQANARNKGKGLLDPSNSLMKQEVVHPSLPSSAKTAQMQGSRTSQIDIPSQEAPVEGCFNASHLRKSLDKTNQLVLAKHVPEAGLLIIPKEEPITVDITPEIHPIPVILHDRNPSSGQSNSQNPSPSRTVNGNGESEVIGEASAGKLSSNIEDAVPRKGSSHLEIACSPRKDVKISVSLQRHDVKAFSLEELLKSFEEKCLRSYKILDPNFSAMNLLNDLVEAVIEVGTSSTNKSLDLRSVHNNQENEMVFDVSPSVGLFSKSAAREVLSTGDNSNFCQPPSTHNNSNSAINIACQEVPGEDSRSLVAVPATFTVDDVRLMMCQNDITKGEESISIPWVNEINNHHPPPFHYIRQNFIFHSARVDFTLSQIQGDKCCSGCFGNCLESAMSCACAQGTGCQFPYTKEGLLTEEFLEDCIFVNRDPQQGQVFYCEECPVEKVNDDMEPCKGHLTRNFIKECWSKCGCNKQCGNRVVQRGITHKLEVFYTTEGKGWGLRTLEALPKGAFVCEYVGEIITCTELHLRKMSGTYGMHSIHPVLLDSAWSSTVLKDEEALCMDATSYGNIARFINHRCLDANLIEIPVEVDTSDHHYYHLAFFTARKVEACEELTWDYGVYFEDYAHLSKAFQCKCGSKFCRNMKRSTRSRCA